MRWAVFLASAAAVLTCAAPPARAAEVTVRVDGAAAARRLQRLRLDTTEVVRDGRAGVVLRGRADARRLRAAGFTPRPVATTAAATADIAGALPSGRTTYRTFADYQADLARLASEHPGLVRPVTIGSSVQGRPIAGVEIAADVARTDDGRPTDVESACTTRASGRRARW